VSYLVCKGCGERFGGDSQLESHDFDSHNCPAIPKPIEGESFEDYSARCDESIAAWKAKEVQP
jgi:hypothetical protein